MTVVMRSVELTAKQIETMHALRPQGKRVIVEQAVNIHVTGQHVTTYFRFGEGKGMKEWVVLRDGRTKQNPTPGRGKP
jgi:hypothetical protein